MATKAELLILRGLHLIIRTTFAPNEPVAQAKHFASVSADIGPWFNDYVAEIAEPIGSEDHDDENTRGAAPAC